MAHKYTRALDTMQPGYLQRRFAAIRREQQAALRAAARAVAAPPKRWPFGERAAARLEETAQHRPLALPQHHEADVIALRRGPRADWAERVIGRMARVR